MVTVGTGRTETIENRRNLFINPLLAVPGTEGAAVTGWSGVVRTSGVAKNNLTTFFSHDVAAITGDSVGAAITFLSPSVQTLTVALRETKGGSFGSQPIIRSKVVTIPAGVATRVDVGGVVSAVDSTGVRLSIIAASSGIQLVDSILELGTTEGGSVFSGSTPAASPYSYTWAGAVNASESIEWLTRDIQVVPRLVDGFEASREIRNVIHDVVNKSAPDVTLRAPGLRAGEFRMLFETQAEALDAFALLAVPQVFTISDPDTPAIGMSFVAAPGDLRIELDDPTRTVWWVVVPFQEVTP